LSKCRWVWKSTCTPALRANRLHRSDLPGSGSDLLLRAVAGVLFTIQIHDLKQLRDPQTSFASKYLSKTSALFGFCRRSFAIRSFLKSIVLQAGRVQRRAADLSPGISVPIPPRPFLYCDKGVLGQRCFAIH
jgi:hypothetical protein